MGDGKQEKGPAEDQPPQSIRDRLREIIFEADTPLGKLFDVVLLVAIVLSIVAVSLESIVSFREAYGPWLRAMEWVFTVLFTVEYVARLATARNAGRYAKSFFGVVDLLAIAPTYLSLFVVGAQHLLVVRSLRLLRVFRVLKLVHFVGEAQVLMAALRASSRKIIVFLGAVVTIVVIVGTAMYVVEGEAGGFTSIPESVYWAVVTMTTVGYGDIAPITPFGKFLASVIMVLGYGIIAVPTGIVSVELAEAKRGTKIHCDRCGAEGHASDARYCRICGADLVR